jgi:hypothetical protein
MNVQDTLNKIKALFSEQPAPAPAAPAAEPAPAPAYALADGTAVEIDKLEVGGIVKIAGTPAPEGEHVLQTGEKITTDANGVITEVKAPEAQPEAPAAPDEMGAFRSEFEAMKGEFQTYKNSFATLQAEFGAQKETISKQDQAIQGLLKVVETISQVPTAEPVQAPKDAFSRQSAEEKQEKFKEIASAFESLKK